MQTAVHGPKEPSPSPPGELVQLRVPALAILHPHSPPAKAPRGSPVLHADFRPAGCFLCQVAWKTPMILQAKGSQLLKTALQLGEVGDSIGTILMMRCCTNSVSMATPYYKAIWIFIMAF